MLEAQQLSISGPKHLPHFKHLFAIAHLQPMGSGNVFQLGSSHSKHAQRSIVSVLLPDSAINVRKMTNLMADAYGNVLCC